VKNEFLLLLPPIGGPVVDIYDVLDSTRKNEGMPILRNA
jgi:hypothetical protein